MTLITFIVISLAVWRLSRGIVKENGPLMMWAKLRARLARTQRRSGGLFDMVSCVQCLSFWIGLVGALWASDGFFSWVGYGLAFSGAALIMEGLLSKNLNSLTVVAAPTTDQKVFIGRSTASK